jgi:hypothetical protein
MKQRIRTILSSAVSRSRYYVPKTNPYHHYYQVPDCPLPCGRSLTQESVALLRSRRRRPRRMRSARNGRTHDRIRRLPPSAVRK